MADTNSELGIILNWTGSVNNALPTTAKTVVYETKDASDKVSIFELETYAFYSALTSNPDWSWEPISCSYWDGSSYVVSAGADHAWTSVDDVRFPQTMADGVLTTADLQTAVVDGKYVPTPHPWVLLRKQNGVDQFSNPKYIYMTIDCRYPTPPHASNIYNQTIQKNVGNTISQNYLIGPSKVEDLVFTELNDPRYNPTLSDGNGNPASVKIKSSFNDFAGVAIKETDPSITSFQNEINGVKVIHDYPSRVCSFIDIVITDVLPDLNIGASAKTTIRPVSLDKELIYCWGFDFIREGHTFTDAVPFRTNYKYHINYVKDRPEFVFMLSKNAVGINNKSFISIFGLSSVQNYPSVDSFEFVTTVINCNPLTTDEGVESYNKSHSICINNNGNNIEFTSATLAVGESIDVGSNTINNFFNTCFRNYNLTYADTGDNLTRGQHPSIYPNLTDITNGNYPIYAPLTPIDATKAAFELDLIHGHESDEVNAPKFISIPSQYFYQLSTYSNGIRKYYWGNQDVNGTTAGTGIINFATNNNITNFNPANLSTTTSPKLKDVWSLASGKYYPKSFFYYYNVATNMIGNGASALVQNFHFKDSLLNDENGNPLLYNTTLVDFATVNTKTSANPINNKTFGFLKSFTATSTSPLTTPEGAYQAAVDILNDPRIIALNAYVAKIRTLSLFDLNPNDLTIPFQTSKYNSRTGKTTYTPVPGSNLRGLVPVPIIKQVGTNPDTTQVSLDPPNNINSNLVSQEKGSDYFSVFKTLISKPDDVTRYELPLVATRYAVDGKNGNLQDLYGITNNNGSTNINRIATAGNEAYDGSYTELPIFLISSVSAKPTVKGYVRDIYWIPAEVNTTTVKLSGNTKNSKIVWKGWSLPWVTTQGF